VDVAIAEPAPVNSKIRRQAFHQSASIGLRWMELLGEPEFDSETKHEDQWQILRFVLSHKKRKQAAVKAA
jgi:hypothetical protein